ncbi:MAG: hypothetical protein ACI9LX_004456 [Paraglaciecola sp.]|jgi:hypothetical protein
MLYITEKKERFVTLHRGIDMLRQTNLNINIGFVLTANLQLALKYRALRIGKKLRWIGIRLISKHKKIR